MSFIALGLSFNWIAGFIFVKKVKTQLLQVLYSQLNSLPSFEGLILFCNLQILWLVITYLFLIRSFNNIIVELKDMELLDGKGEQLWEKTYGEIPCQTIQAVLISLALA